MLTSEHPEPQCVLQQKSTLNPLIVPVQATLSPQEIERICRAFIRIISAKEINHEELPTTTKPTTK